MKISSTLFLGLFVTVTFLFFNFQNAGLLTQLTTNEEVPYLQKETPGWYKMKANAQLTLEDFLHRHHSDLGLTEWDELELYRTEVDDLGMTHSRFQQFHRGIPVEFAELLIHEKDGFVQTFNGKWISNLDLNDTPNFSKEAAIQRALDYLPAEKYLWEDEGAEAMLKKIQKRSDATFYPNPELVWLGIKDVFENINYRLAYKMDIQGEIPLFRQQVFIDAKDECILLDVELIHTADVPGVAETKYNETQNIVTDSIAPDMFRLVETGRGGGIETYDMNTGLEYGEAVDFVDTDNFWDNVNDEIDEAATDAHFGMEATFDYLEQEHNYYGVDGNGMAFISYVHYDENYVNAFWNGNWATFGDGNGGTWSPLTSLDVVAHEFAHGVTDATASLIYMDESGALNESFSDIIGAAVEFWATPDLADWFIGEDFNTNGNGFRSMQSPNSNGDPDTYDGTNWYVGPDDNGGVHTNSGVQNFWFYLLTEGGSSVNDLGQSFSVEGLGLDTSAAIAFRNLRYYLTNSSIYLDAREGSLQAAEDLYGACSEPVTQTGNAWFAVGLGNGFAPNDLRILDITNPTGVNCGLTNEEFPTFQFRYNGCNAPLESETEIPVALQVDGGAIIKDTIILAAIMEAGDTLSFTFDTPVSGLETQGEHFLRVWTEFPDDPYLRNDTASIEIQTIIAQNSDFRGEELQNPQSSCWMESEAVELEVSFLGCDSIAAGTEVLLSYSLNQNDTISEIAILENTLFYGESFSYTFNEAIDFSNEIGQNSLESWVAFSTDFLNENDILPTEFITNPKITVEDKLLTFEEAAISLDSIYTNTNNNSDAFPSALAASTGDTGLQMTGGDSFTAFFAGELTPPDEFNHWEVNEGFNAQTCICVDATSMQTVDLSFDLKQTNSPIYQLQFGVDLPYASCFRVLINQEPITDTYNPVTTIADPFINHILDLDEWAGTNFEVCFESRNLLSNMLDPIGNGDNAYLDNILISSEIVNTNEISPKFIEFTAFPNPNNGNFNLSWSSQVSGKIDIEIFDILGKRVKTIAAQNLVGKNQSFINLEHVTKGAYFVRISDGGDSMVKRVVVF